MNDADNMNKLLFSQRLIVGAMITGITIFTIVVLAIGDINEGKSDLGRMLFPALLAVAAGGVFVPPVLKRVLLQKARDTLRENSESEDARGAALRYWQASSSIGAAMAEAFGLFANVVYMVTGSAPALIVTALSILLLLVRMPSRAQMAEFVPTLDGG